MHPQKKKQHRDQSSYTGYATDKIIDLAIGVGATILGVVVYDKYFNNE